MDQQRGMFFVIEGGNGTGKTTQFALLKDKLERAGYEVAVFDFPQYSQPSSYFVRQYLAGKYGSAKQVGPYTGSLFYALDRYEAAQRIREALDSGKIVLANRFTASNMAHQAGQFSHVEERRGFYIWLDNLEFMLLKIPRPDMSLVLHVPAAISAELIAKRSAEEGKETDIHDRDKEHLEVSVRTYEELCQLFPRDFKQIDCVRSGKLIAIDHVHQMVWEKIQPYLPSPPEITPDQQPVSLEETSDTEERVLSPESQQPQVIDVSAVGMMRMSMGHLVDPTLELAKDRGGRQYVIPETLHGQVRERYIEVMDSLFELHAEMKHRLRPEHHASLRGALPLAASRPFVINHELLMQLKNASFPESRALLRSLGEDPGELPKAAQLQEFENGFDGSIQGTFNTAAAKDVRLLSTAPRSELDSVADMLYATSNESFTDLSMHISHWPYEKKAATYLAYIKGASVHNAALKRVQYSFEIVAECGALRDIQVASPDCTLLWQQFSPRNGYDIPENIEDAGLADLYERCFDISLELYSDLQAAGLNDEAEYAILHGHIVRFVCTFDANQVRKLVQEIDTADEQTANVLLQIKERIQITHPLFAGIM